MTNRDRCYNIFDLREVTKRRLADGIFEYVALLFGIAPTGMLASPGSRQLLLRC
jgi:hypothetical protein